MTPIDVTAQTGLALPAAWLSSLLDISIGISAAGSSFEALRLAWRAERTSTPSSAAVDAVREQDGTVAGAIMGLLILDSVGAGLLVVILLVFQPDRLTSLFAGPNSWATWMLLGFVSPTGAAAAFVGRRLSSVVSRDAKSGTEVDADNKHRMRNRIRRRIFDKAYAISDERVHRSADSLVRIELPLRSGVIATDEFLSSVRRYVEKSGEPPSSELKRLLGVPGAVADLEGCVDLLMHLIEEGVYVCNNF